MGYANVEIGLSNGETLKLGSMELDAANEVKDKIRQALVHGIVMVDFTPEFQDDYYVATSHIVWVNVYMV